MRNRNICNSKARCPKCKGKDLKLTELWKNHSIVFIQEEGVVDRSDGSLEAGEAYRVEGYCESCEHRWKFRRALQIDDVI